MTDAELIPEIPMTSKQHAFPLLSAMVLLCAAPGCGGAITPPLPLGGLKPVSVEGTMAVDRSAGGDVLNVGELVYSRGIGATVPSRITFRVPAGYGRFEAWAGFDITTVTGSGSLRVLVDGKVAFDSGAQEFHGFSRGRGPAMNADRPMKVTVRVGGGSTLTLEARGRGEGLLADWADARLLPPDWPEYRPRPPTESKLAALPPMGWNSWNTFGTEISHEIICGMADALVAKGFKDAGYVYVNLDDGWQAKGNRDEKGNPLIDKKKFPQGLKALGDYIHARGLKFGLYSRPDWVGGSRMQGLWAGGNDRKFAKALAAWGADYLKYDFGEKMSFYAMGRALKELKRPVFYSVCGWGKAMPWAWCYHFGAGSWRTTYDVMSVWETGSDRNPVGIMDAVDQTEPLGPFAGPGHWNDPDMLIIGLKGGTWAQRKHMKKATRCNDIEQRSQMSLYCLLAAPLIIGGDVREMDRTAVATLLNREAIAIDQDPLGVPAWRAYKMGDREVWKRPLAHGDIAIGLLNRGAKETRITATFRQLNITGAYRARDLWKHENLGPLPGRVSMTVRSHETVLLRLSACE